MQAKSDADHRRMNGKPAKPAQDPLPVKSNHPYLPAGGMAIHISSQGAAVYAGQAKRR